MLVSLKKKLYDFINLGTYNTKKIWKKNSKGERELTLHCTGSLMRVELLALMQSLGRKGLQWPLDGNGCVLIRLEPALLNLKVFRAG